MKIFRMNVSQKGMTLIEIMIAMLIGVFLMTGVIQIFVSARQAYKLQENLSRLQENGRIAMDLITKDVRMAGYTNYSCLPVNPTANDPPFGVTNARCCTTNSVLAGTDIIRIFQWPTAGSCPIPAAAKCLTNPPDVTCPENANNERAFFITNSSQTGLPVLARYEGENGISPERVEGIEDMSVLYGVDTDYNVTAKCPPVAPDIAPPECYVPNYYVPAQATWTAADWANVVSIRISLLAITPDNGLTDAPQPYTFNGTTVTPPQLCSSNGVITASASPSTPTTAPTCAAGSKLVDDTRIRRVFSSTIAVRNRLL